MKMKWLVTAFEPFGGADSNSSLIVARELEKMHWSDQVQFLYPLPVSYSRAFTQLHSLLQETDQIAGILALGQAEGRDKVGLERVALNFRDARIPDNDQAQPREQKIDSLGPELYWSAIPWPQFEGGEKCELSYSAGTFVCNNLMYQLIAWANQYAKNAGFIHIPLLESQKDFARHWPRMKDQDALACVAQALRFVVAS